MGNIWLIWGRRIAGDCAAAYITQPRFELPGEDVDVLSFYWLDYKQKDARHRLLKDKGDFVDPLSTWRCP